MLNVVAPIVAWFARVFLIPLFHFIKADPNGRVARLLCKVLRHRDIMKKGEGLYLRRHYLTPRIWPVRVFLHLIIRSDVDRHVHDHPFDFSTTILKGAYREQLCNDPDSDDWRLAYVGTTLDNPAEHQHKVHILEPVWSLVVTSRARREWGFQTEIRWVDWRLYLGKIDSSIPLEDRIP